MLTMFVIWAALATILLGLAITRKIAARNEDDFVHVNDAKIGARQVSLSKTLEGIDKWGKLLTTLVVLYGMGLLAAYLYASWNESQQIILK